MTDILKFGKHSEMLSKFLNLVNILKFGQNSEIGLVWYGLVESV